ncbi:MAG: hypothetical protein H6665_09615 [Ardenticatenaceae bacterium]|nr:hypothetical protein [Ardenticatenaceae bacterium]
MMPKIITGASVKENKRILDIEPGVVVPNNMVFDNDDGIDDLRRLTT